MVEHNVVCFKYDGGSNPGQTRMVFVFSDDGKTLNTWDFEKGAVRHFSWDKIYAIEYIQGAIVLDKSNIPTVAIKSILDGWEQQGYTTYGGTHHLVAVRLVEKEKPVTCKIYSWNNHQDFHLYFHANGKTAEFDFKEDPNGGTITARSDGYKAAVVENAKLADLISCLQSLQK